jgi:hypothetical protein
MAVKEGRNERTKERRKAGKEGRNEGRNNILYNLPSPLPLYNVDMYYILYDLRLQV